MTTPTPKSHEPQAVITAPERLWLCVSDDTADYDRDFPKDTSEVTWATDHCPVVCGIGYVRSDVHRSAMQALRVENARLRAAVAVLAAECSNGRTWVADQSTHSGSPYQTYGEYSPEYQAARAATNSNPDAKRAIEEAT